MPRLHRIKRSSTQVTIRLPRLRSSPSFFHPNTNRRTYRLDSDGEIGGALRDATPVVLGLGRALLSPSFVRVFDDAFRPHLDQMQHAPINDTPHKRQHCFGIRNAAKVIREVGVNDVRVTAVQAFLYLLRRQLGIAVLPVDVLLGRKVGIEDRF